MNYRQQRGNITKLSSTCDRLLSFLTMPDVELCYVADAIAAISQAFRGQGREDTRCGSHRGDGRGSEEAMKEVKKEERNPATENNS